MGFLTAEKMPFCAGCAYHLVVRNLAKALDGLQLRKEDVVLVSDIGCCGLIDKLLDCHTIHGLHGRSAALGLGITLGLDDPRKKVIIFMGDGGATIGMQHILEAARLNVDMTCIVVNNLVYGMTGGQPSGLSPKGWFAKRSLNDRQFEPYDVARLAHDAGAAFTTRFMAKGNISGRMADIISREGFSVIEMVGPCTSHGVRKISELEEMDFPEVEFVHDREVFRMEWKRPVPDPMTPTHALYEATREVGHSIIIAGTAGEGVQKAGEVLARASAITGLHITRKSEYPITVGTGFSLAEVTISSVPICFTGMENTDAMVVSSMDGLDKVRHLLADYTGVLVVDDTLELPPTNAKVFARPFRKTTDRKTNALAATMFLCREMDLVPVDAFREAVKDDRFRESMLAAIEAGNEL